MTNNKQAGVTLLISILVLSGLVLTSLAVAAFAIQEIRSSRAIIVAEPAISAAESAGEQGLWAIKRATSLTTCPTQTSVNLSNGALVNSCKSYGSATLNLKANTALVFYLYDPDNINGDIDLLAYPYTSLTVIHQSGPFQVTVNVVRLDGAAVGAQPVIVAPGGMQTINIPAVPAGSEGRMKVTLQSTGNATVNVTTNQGMPNFPTVNAGGCASKTAVSDCNSATQELFNRRINITVPQ
jgi:Tfp pilus assembly protein PilX